MDISRWLTPCSTFTPNIMLILRQLLPPKNTFTSSVRASLVEISERIHSFESFDSCKSNRISTLRWRFAQLRWRFDPSFGLFCLMADTIRRKRTLVEFHISSRISRPNYCFYLGPYWTWYVQEGIRSFPIFGIKNLTKLRNVRTVWRMLKNCVSRIPIDWHPRHSRKESLNCDEDSIHFFGGGGSPFY